jgi:hypothetical protein
VKRERVSGVGEWEWEERPEVARRFCTWANTRRKVSPIVPIVSIGGWVDVALLASTMALAPPITVTPRIN